MKLNELCEKLNLNDEMVVLPRLLTQSFEKLGAMRTDKRFILSTPPMPKEPSNNIGWVKRYYGNHEVEVFISESFFVFIEPFAPGRENKPLHKVEDIVNIMTEDEKFDLSFASIPKCSFCRITYDQKRPDFEETILSLCITNIDYDKYKKRWKATVFGSEEMARWRYDEHVQSVYSRFDSANTLANGLVGVGDKITDDMSEEEAQEALKEFANVLSGVNDLSAVLKDAGFDELPIKVVPNDNGMREDAEATFDIDSREAVEAAIHQAAQIDGLSEEDVKAVYGVDIRNMEEVVAASESNNTDGARIKPRKETASKTPQKPRMASKPINSSPPSLVDKIKAYEDEKGSDNGSE